MGLFLTLPGASWLVTVAYLEWKFLLSKALIKGSIFCWRKNHNMFGRLTSFQLWRICFCIRFNGGSYMSQGTLKDSRTRLALLLALGMIPKLFKPGRKCT